MHTLVRAAIADPLTRAMLAMTCHAEARSRTRLKREGLSRFDQGWLVTRCFHVYVRRIFAEGLIDMCVFLLRHALPRHTNDVLPLALKHGTLRTWQRVCHTPAARVALVWSVPEIHKACKRSAEKRMTNGERALEEVLGIVVRHPRH